LGPENISLESKIFSGKNALAYSASVSKTMKRVFKQLLTGVFTSAALKLYQLSLRWEINEMGLPSGVNVIKLFKDVIDEFP
jgi:hypothetical protein